MCTVSLISEGSEVGGGDQGDVSLFCLRIPLSGNTVNDSRLDAAHTPQPLWSFCVERRRKLLQLTELAWCRLCVTYGRLATVQH